MRSLEQKRNELTKLLQEIETAAYRRGWDDAKTTAMREISNLWNSPTVGTTLIIRADL